MLPGTLDGLKQMVFFSVIRFSELYFNVLILRDDYYIQPCINLIYHCKKSVSKLRAGVYVRNSKISGLFFVIRLSEMYFNILILSDDYCIHYNVVQQFDISLQK